MEKVVSFKYLGMKNARDLYEALQDLIETEKMDLNTITIVDGDVLEIRKVVSEVEESPHFELNFRYDS